jgi:hypothetical protein
VAALVEQLARDNPGWGSLKSNSVSWHYPMLSAEVIAPTVDMHFDSRGVVWVARSTGNYTGSTKLTGLEPFGGAGRCGGWLRCCARSGAWVVAGLPRVTGTARPVGSAGAAGTEVASASAGSGAAHP